jgi:hypothetical protein
MRRQKDFGDAPVRIEPSSRLDGRDEQCLGGKFPLKRRDRLLCRWNRQPISMTFLEARSQVQLGRASPLLWRTSIMRLFLRWTFAPDQSWREPNHPARLARTARLDLPCGKQGRLQGWRAWREFSRSRNRTSFLDIPRPLCGGDIVPCALPFPLVPERRRTALDKAHDFWQRIGTVGQLFKR